MLRQAPVAALLLLWALLSGCARARTPATEPAPGAPPTAANSKGVRPLTYVQLDIGQGDSQLIVSPDGHAMLVDGGPPGRTEQILSTLKAHSVSRLDVAVASHPHNDHIGSLDDVVRAVPVGRFLDSGFNYGSDAQKRLLQSIKERRVPFALARAGESFALGEAVTVSVLAPRSPLLTGTESDANNNSVVLKVTYGAVRFLLTGDMEEKERERLLAEGSDLAAEVYKVAHHGSRNGTDAEFLSRVRPRVALLSCELGNDYGHPHREALAALTSAGAAIYRTDLQGALTLTTDGRTWQVVPERAASADLTRAGREIGPGGSRKPGASERVGSPAVERATSNAASVAGRIIGNRRSKVYRRGGTGRLPSPENRVYFRTEEEARREGYRPAGDGGR